MRTFKKGEKVRLKSEALHPDSDGAATVVLVSPNQSSLGFEFARTCALRNTDGGILLTDFLALMQADDGKLTDLFQNSWEII